MNKFVCPQCGGQLYVLKEHIYDKEQNINSKTGKLMKHITRTYRGDCPTLVHIQCRKCNFEINEEDDGYSDLQNLLKNFRDDENCYINKDDTDWWGK